MRRIYKRLDNGKYYFGRKELSISLNCSPANITNIQKGKDIFIIKGIEIEEIPFANFTNEIWKNIDIYGFYKISSYGRVKRCYKNKTDKLLNLNTIKHGYKQVQLCYNGKRVLCLVHRLVAEAFIPNPKKLNYINHKNKRTDDNRVENLEWVTASENNKHARQYPLIKIKSLALCGLSDSLELEPKTALKKILEIIKEEL